MDKTSLLSQANKIRNATELHENSAERVGKLLVDIIESIGDVAALAQLVDRFSVRLEALTGYFTPVDDLENPVPFADAVALRANRGLFSHHYISTKGMSDGGSGGGMDEELLAGYLKEHGYVTAAELPSLSGYATEQWVLGRGYALDSALKAHAADTAVHVTAAERLRWNTAASSLDSILGADSDTIINKWDEVVNFLDTYTEADTLANLLSNKVDKRDGYSLSKNDFTDTLLQKLNGIEAGANKYILPVAKAAVLGGVMVGASLSVSATGLLDLPELHAAAATCCKVAYDRYGRVTGGSDLAEGDIPELSMEKITGLQTALDKKLDKAVFDDLFEKVKRDDGTWAIRAKYGLFSNEFIATRGTSDDSGAGGGGIDVTFLEDYLSGKSYATESWVSGRLGDYYTKGQSDNRYYTKTECNSLFQPKGNYLTQHQSLDSCAAVGNWQGNLDAKSGIYRIVDIGDKDTLPHKDTGSSILHFKWDVNASQQLMMDYADERVYARFEKGNVTGNWNKLAYISDIPASMAWGSITGKPTTLGGYGITDAYTKGDADGRYVNVSGNQNVGGAKTFTATVAGNYGFRADGAADRLPWFEWHIPGINYTKAMMTSDGTVHFVSGADTVPTRYGSVKAASFIRHGGTSAQFLKADGTVDSTSYLSRAGGSMATTAVVTNLNADMIDGVHNGDLTANRLHMRAATSDLNSPSWDTLGLTYCTFDRNAKNAPTTADNANGVLNISAGTHGTAGEYGGQIAFQNNGRLYWRGWAAGTPSAWHTVAYLEDVYTKAEADSRYVNADGDAMSGNLSMGNVGSITNLKVEGGLYWNPCVESASDSTDVASITLHKTGVAGGSELRIKMQNDSNDVVNIDANNYNCLRVKGAVVWNASNDGSGSGLDADLLDGYHESAYFRNAIAVIAPEDVMTKLPGNRSGSYQVSRSGWYGSATVFYTGSSNSGLAFYRPGGSNSIPRILVATDSTSNWVDKGVILTSAQIANSSDIAAFTADGFYWTATDGDTATLKNSPFSTTFAMITHTCYHGGDDLRRSRVAWDSYGAMKVFDDRSIAGAPGTWYDVLTGKNYASILDSRYVTKADLAKMFTVVTEGGKSSIKAMMGLWSADWIATKGISDSGGASGAGIDVTFLESYLKGDNADKAVYATQSWVGSAVDSKLTTYATQSWVNSQGFLKSHQSLANYVTLNTEQEIIGQKFFSRHLIINCPWDTEGRYLMFREGGSALYGGYMKYTGGDQLRIGTRNNSTNDTDAISINRGSTVVDFLGGITLPYGEAQWIHMATRISQIRAARKNSADGAHSLFTLNNSTGSAISYGGLGTSIGFYGFYKSRLDAGTNGLDWSTVWNVDTGRLDHSGIFAADSLVKHGGTAAQALMADGSIRGVHTLSAVTNLGWNGTSGQLATINTLAYWNGAYSGTASNLQYCDRGRFGTIVTMGSGDYVRAYYTSSDNIDSDWGQSVKTFDPIPAGTPPEQNPNITLLSLGDNFKRRKQLAFTWNNDNIYYRRRVDNSFTSWVKLLHTGNYAATLDSRYYTKGDADGRYVTALGTNGNYLTWTKNGAVENITVPYAANADKIDNIQSTHLFKRQGRLGSYNIDTLQEFASRDIQPTSEATIEGTKPPANSWGTLLTFKSLTDAGGIQIAGISGNLYFRQAYNANFSGAWKTILHPDNYAFLLDGRYVKKSGDTMTGDLLFSNSGTGIRQIRFTMGDNDFGRIAVGATASNAGWMEIATADDGTEPIYVRQYSGTYTSIARSATLLDGSGNTAFPGRVNASYFTANSTTLCNNLNADLLDGRHSSGFSWRKSLGIQSDTHGAYVLLCPAYDGTLLDGGFFYGTVYITRGNAQAFNAKTAVMVQCGGQYNANLAKYQVLSASVNILGLFKVKYNGTAYIALKMASTSIMNFAVEGMWGGNSDPMVVNSDGAGVTEEAALSTTPQIATNAASATRLQGTYKLWGRDFYGNDVDGAMTINYTGETGIALYRKEAGSGAFIRFYNANQTANYFRIGMFGDSRFGIGYNSGTDAINILTNGNVGIGTTAPAYKLDVNGDSITRGWLRTTGQRGWYSQDYGGGWYMTDTNWIRNFNNKSLYMTTATIRTDGRIEVGSNGSKFLVDSSGNVTTIGKLTLNLSGENIVSSFYKLNSTANNPYLNLKIGSIDYYVQAYNSKLCMGPSAAKGISVDHVGDVEMSGNAKIYGNLLLKGAGTYGNRLSFGDSDYVYLEETEDDELHIYANNGIYLGSDDGYVNIAENAGLLFTGAGLLTADAASKAVCCSCGFYSTKFISTKGTADLSDMRLKRVLAPVELKVEDIAAAPLFIHEWRNEPGSRAIGSSAQYWEGYAPEAVHRLGDYRTMEYDKLGVAMGVSLSRRLLDVESRHSRWLGKHETRMQRLERRVRELEKELETLKQNNHAA